MNSLWGSDPVPSLVLLLWDWDETKEDDQKIVTEFVWVGLHLVLPRVPVATSNVVPPLFIFHLDLPVFVVYKSCAGMEGFGDRDGVFLIEVY